MNYLQNLQQHVYKSRNERIEEILSEIEICRNSKKKSILYFQLGLYFYYHQNTGHDRDMLTAFMTSFKLNTENFAGLNRVIQFYYDKSDYETAMTYINKGLKSLTKRIKFDKKMRPENPDAYCYYFWEIFHKCSLKLDNTEYALETAKKLMIDNDVKNAKRSANSLNIAKSGKLLEKAMKVSGITWEQLSDKIHNTICKYENIKTDKKLSLCLGIPCDKKDLAKLDRLLISIRNQTLQPEKIIFSFSRIKDHKKIKPIIKQWKKFYDVSAYFIKDLWNPSANKNQILSHPQDCELLSFIDADDEMHPNRLELLSDLFNYYNPDLVVHGYGMRYGVFNIIPKYFRIRKPEEVEARFEYLNCLSQWDDGRVHHGHITINKKVRKAFQFNSDLTIGEDVDYIQQLCDRGYNAFHVELPLSNYIPSVQQVGKKCISFCFTIKNRWNMTYEEKYGDDGICIQKSNLRLFEKCLTSLVRLQKSDEVWELCISDWNSSDCNLKSEVKNILKNTPHAGKIAYNFCNIDQPVFSRGYGLNKAAKLASLPYLFFVDVDMMFLNRRVIENVYDYLSKGFVYFPICSSFTNVTHTDYFQQIHGFGNVALSRRNFNRKPDSWMNKYSWGEEDVDYFTYYNQFGVVVRDYVKSFMHQWHPSEISDFQRLYGKKSDNSIKNYIVVSLDSNQQKNESVLNKYYTICKENYKKMLVYTSDYDKEYIQSFEKYSDILFIDKADTIDVYASKDT